MVACFEVQAPSVHVPDIKVNIFFQHTYTCIATITLFKGYCTLGESLENFKFLLYFITDTKY